MDLDLFDPAKISVEAQDKLKKEVNIKKDDFIISYLGSIGGWYLTDQMMKFLAIISNKIEKTKFLFITPYEDEIIFKKAEKFGIPREKIIVKHAQRHEVPLLLSLSNYSIFFIKPCYSKKSSSPTKHGEIMAMGIPVITNAGVGDVAEIVAENSSGIILDEFNEAQFHLIAEKISGIDFDKVMIRNGAEKTYNLKSAVEKYKNMYAAILNNNL